MATQPKHRPAKECSHCHERNGPLSACSRCHSAFYCSETCQRADYKVHKPLCKSVAAAAEKATVTGVVAEAAASAAAVSAAAATATTTPREGISDSGSGGRDAGHDLPSRMNPSRVAPDLGVLALDHNAHLPVVRIRACNDPQKCSFQPGSLRAHLRPNQRLT